MRSKVSNGKALTTIDVNNGAEAVTSDILVL